jgi:hypothetical protein
METLERGDPGAGATRSRGDAHHHRPPASPTPTTPTRRPDPTVATPPISLPDSQCIRGGAVGGAGRWTHEVVPAARLAVPAPGTVARSSASYRAGPRTGDLPLSPLQAGSRRQLDGMRRLRHPAPVLVRPCTLHTAAGEYVPAGSATREASGPAAATRNVRTPAAISCAAWYAASVRWVAPAWHRDMVTAGLHGHLAGTALIDRSAAVVPGECIR